MKKTKKYDFGGTKVRGYGGLSKIQNLTWLIICAVCAFICIACSKDDDDDMEEVVFEEVVEDISDDIPGEWVYDHPEDNVWQSMKFVAEGMMFCYSDKKSEWTNALKRVNQGNYGVRGKQVSAANGSTYLDMTVSSINGYQFTARLKETLLDLTFHKVVMRTHLGFGESVTPQYAELVDTTIIGYRSHDEKLAVVDENTGEITAVANNGRTYIDVLTPSGTAVVKVMMGKVDDGDEDEMSPITKKILTPPEKITNLPIAILGRWVWDTSYWEVINFLEDGKVYYSNQDKARGIYNDNAPGNYTVDTENNRITLNVKPTAGSPMTVILSIISINKYSFTAKFYLSDGVTFTGTYTYAKLLGTVEMNNGDVHQPDYRQYVDSETVITGFKSHHPESVEVDMETGELKAKKQGRTNIDIITDEGTSVIEVMVL